MNRLFKFDKNIVECGHATLKAAKKAGTIIIGTDEAGRGPGAGDVFGAAVCFRENFDNLLETQEFNLLKRNLNDSKKISPKLRAKLYEIIRKCSYYSIRQVSVEKIEEINILNAALLTMKLSCEEVTAQVGNGMPCILVDGNHKIKDFSHPQQTIIKGDSKSASIAAASILAKVARDNYMQELHEKHPLYGWAQNKGYLTRKHIEAIKNCGVTKFHRKSFLSKISNPQNEVSRTTACSS
jgi:ribonuclease HII